jgi:hypothetical protein
MSWVGAQGDPCTATIFWSIVGSELVEYVLCEEIETRELTVQFIADILSLPYKLKSSKYP